MISAQSTDKATLGNSPYSSSLQWDSVTKLANPAFTQTNLTYTFSCTNVSSQPVTITGIILSCGCTSVDHPPLPWKLSPNELGKLNVQLDTTGKSGQLTKTILIYSSAGPKTLIIKANLPKPSDTETRQKNQEAARRNRQTVFKGECAKCHAEPTMGQSGDRLFAAACGICHSVEHRATMVPDLKTLKATPTKEAWENIIRNGKPDSLMPAFEQKQGGPLTDAQITSLVEYLSKAPEFQRASSSSKTAPSLPTK